MGNATSGMDFSIGRMLADVGLREFFSHYRGDRQLPNDDDDEKGTSVVVLASCAIGDMTDWLKANPAFSMEDYQWKLSVPFIKVMASDATHVAYLSEKQAKEYKQQKRKANAKKKSEGITDDPEEFARALGIPSF